MYVFCCAILLRLLSTSNESNEVSVKLGMTLYPD